VSTHDTSLTHVTGQIFSTSLAHVTGQIFLYLIWQETLQAAKSTCSCLKGDELMHLLCKFHTRACFPWQALMALNL